MQKGLVHIYCGDGKGKTTAAVGLAVRAAGRGLKVLFVQFLKGDDTGELRAFDLLPNIRALHGPFGLKFVCNMSQEEKAACASMHDGLFRQALELCAGEKTDVLILDEIIAAYNLRLVDRGAVLEFLRSRPAQLEVVLTGRDPAPEICAFAHYISDIKKVRHPFDVGIAARVGIEK